MPIRLALCLTAAALLAACQTIPETKWAPRENADLAKDLADCQAQADKVDITSPDAYSDGRYGAAAAMAGHMDKDDLRGGGQARMVAAIRDSCMSRKGWTAIP